MSSQKREVPVIEQIAVADIQTIGAGITPSLNPHRYEAEPETDPERDQRTVFAYQISLKADQTDITDFFSKAGKVRDVRLIIDGDSGHSKGAYIEFDDAKSVPTAITLSGQLLLGEAVMVKPSGDEKNE